MHSPPALTNRLPPTACPRLPIACPLFHIFRQNHFPDSRKQFNGSKQPFEIPGIFSLRQTFYPIGIPVYS
jgi:hypothetical protein